MQGIFGPKSHDYFAYFDPDMCCWKTSQATFHWGSETFSETWPDSGSMRNGFVYELRLSEPPICENVFSLWPTARTEDGESCGNHPGAIDSLSGATKNWLTPHGMHGTDHTGKQATNWPTPDAGKGGPRNGKLDGGHQITIAQLAENWLTPQASDAKMAMGGKRKPELKPPLTGSVLRPAPLIHAGAPSSPSAPTLPRRLNPRFVEWVMGFPPEWTELCKTEPNASEPLETRLCHNAPSGSAAAC